jgi:toxin CcdB
MANLVIRQFDVFTNPSPSTRSRAPYIVVLQSHLFEELSTLVVAPLMRIGAPSSESKVLLEVEFGGETLVMNAALLANIERHLLSRSRGSLTAHEDAIRRALDRLFTGF